MDERVKKGVLKTVGEVRQVRLKTQRRLEVIIETEEELVLGAKSPKRRLEAVYLIIINRFIASPPNTFWPRYSDSLG